MKARRRPAPSARKGAARTVRDIMVRKLVTVGEDALLGMARSYMRLSRIRHLLVLREGKLAGVLSERDVLGAAANHGVSKAWNMTVAEVMSTRVVTTTPSASIASAARILVNSKLGCLPVLSEGELVGIVTTSDLLRDQAFAETPGPDDARWV